MLTLAYARSRHDNRDKKTTTHFSWHCTWSLILSLNLWITDGKMSCRVKRYRVNRTSAVRRCFTSSQTVVGCRKKKKNKTVERVSPGAPLCQGGTRLRATDWLAFPSFFFPPSPELLDEAAALLHCFSSAILSSTITASRRGSAIGETRESNQIWAYAFHKKISIYASTYSIRRKGFVLGISCASNEVDSLTI